MIKNVTSASIQATPIVAHDDNIGRSKPVSSNKLINNQGAVGWLSWDHSSSSNIDDNMVEEFFGEDCVINKDEKTELETEEYDENENGDQWIDSIDGHLTTSDIDCLWMALNYAETACSSQPVLQSAHLSTPPDPKEIKDTFSAVMGDIFYTMDCTQIPHHPEAKKGYFVMLRETFFIWNPSKLKELDQRMIKHGQILENVRHQQYFNTQLFCGCVDWYSPAPSILYWRV